LETGKQGDSVRHVPPGSRADREHVASPPRRQDRSQRHPATVRSGRAGAAPAAHLHLALPGGATPQAAEARRRHQAGARHCDRLMALATRIASGEEGTLYMSHCWRYRDQQEPPSSANRSPMRSIPKAGNSPNAAYEEAMYSKPRAVDAHRASEGQSLQILEAPVDAGDHHPWGTVAASPHRLFLILHDGDGNAVGGESVRQDLGNQLVAFNGCINFAPLSRTFGLANADSRRAKQASAAAMSEVFADLRDHPLSGRHRLGWCRGLEQLWPAVLDLADCRPDRPPARRSLPRDG
jgi:hypothetical protein